VLAAVSSYWKLLFHPASDNANVSVGNGNNCKKTQFKRHCKGQTYKTAGSQSAGPFQYGILYKPSYNKKT